MMKIHSWPLVRAPRILSFLEHHIDTEDRGKRSHSLKLLATPVQLAQGLRNVLVHWTALCFCHEEPYVESAGCCDSRRLKVYTWRLDKDTEPRSNGMIGLPLRPLLRRSCSLQIPIWWPGWMAGWQGRVCSVRC